MNKKQLSTWQIARQQKVTPQYVRRLAAHFEKPQHVRFYTCGRKPQALAPHVRQLVLSAHGETLCGAVNLAKVLRERGVRVSHHRVHAVLSEHGLAKKEPKKRKRRKWIRWERRRSNSLWHADYSEINGKHVLIVEDDASRFIVGYGEFAEATAENARRVFAQAFAVYGLPRQVLTDHGSQFVNVHDAQGEHVFSGWLKGLGVKPIYARVKHPQTNGKVERLFQTIAKGWRAFGSLKKAVQWYNEVRPHMSLELASGRLRTPAQAYADKRFRK